MATDGARSQLRLQPGTREHDGPAAPFARRPHPEPGDPVMHLPLDNLNAQRALGHARLPVSHPLDADERQAETAAEAFVVGRPAPSREAFAASPPTMGARGGMPLVASVRGEYETFFGANLSGVRVHDDESTARVARSLNARAFTVGANVFLGRGGLDPISTAGRRLLAHELAHTLQPPRPEVRRQAEPTAADGGIPELSATDKLGRALGYCGDELGPAAAAELGALTSPTALIAIAAFAALFIASQVTPIGWIADALAVITIGVSVIFLGLMIIDIARDLVRFFGAISATTDAELHAAGQALARAISRAGIGLIIALLTRGIGRGLGPPRPRPVATFAFAATPEGVPAIMPVAAGAEAAAPSAIQHVASMAVMTPPPGQTPTEPNVTSSSSGSGTGGPTRPQRVEVGPEDVAAMRTRYNIPPGRDTLAVGRTDAPKLEGQTFEGASRSIQSEAPVSQAPPQVTSPRSNVQFLDHAEQGVINQFVDAVKSQGLSASDLEGRTLAMHISNETGVCSACTQGLGNLRVDPGVLAQLSMRFRGLTIRVTWNRADGGLGYLVIQNGETLFSSL